MLLLRNAAATILIPGMVVGLVPYFIVRRGGAVAIELQATSFAAVAVIAAGAAILLWCVAQFAFEGQGTLAPIDPPTRLVQRGLYRYTRNPMYVGALLVLVGQVLLFRSRPLAVYAAAWFVVVNLFVMFYEEPALHRRFGAAYDEYCRRVPRWGV